MPLTNVLNLGDVVLPGDGFPSIFEFTIPVLPGLRGAYLMAGGEVGRNIAPGGPAPEVIGTPEIGPAGVTFSPSTGYIDTKIAETPEMTLVAVVRGMGSASPNQPGMVGNFETPALGGIALYAFAENQLSGNAVRNGVNAATTIYTSDVSTLSLTAFRSYEDANKPNRLTNFTAGQTSQATNAAVPRTLNARSLHIGRLFSGSFAGKSEISLVLIYDRALSDAEMADVAEWARGYMAAHDVVV